MIIVENTNYSNVIMRLLKGYFVEGNKTIYGVECFPLQFTALF